MRTDLRRGPRAERTERVQHSIRLELFMIVLVLTMGVLATVAIVLPAVVSG